MIVDAHMHHALNGFTTEKIFKYLSDNNIHKAWFLTWEDIYPPIPKINRNFSIEKVLEIYRQDKDRIVPFYAPDPRRENVCELLHYYKSIGIRGCGELKVAMDWEDPNIIKLLDCIDNLGFPLVFHMEKERYHYVSPTNSWFNEKFEKLMNGAFNGISRQYIELFINKTGLLKKKIKRNMVFFPGYLFNFSSLEKVIQQYPNIKFIAHGPEFWKNISAFPSTNKFFDKGKIKKEGLACQLLNTYPNLYADISGKSGYNALSRDEKFTKQFLEKYYNKLLFGTDNFMFNQKKFIDSFSLPDYKASYLFYKNSEKLLK